MNTRRFRVTAHLIKQHGFSNASKTDHQNAFRSVADAQALNANSHAFPSFAPA